MQDFFKVLLLSMAPVSELRGAIPLGVGLGFSPIEASLISVFGNAIIVPILYFILKPLFKFLKGFKAIRRFVESYENRAAKKLDNYRKYRFFGLVLLVAIPIPTTGVYTGVVASHVMGMRAKTSISANILGVFISGTIVFLITSGFIHIF